MTTLLDRGRYYGETTSHREAGGVGLSETSHPGGSEAPGHAHEHPYLCLVLSGGFTERFGARSEECGPGAVVFHPAGEEHADRFGGAGARCFNIQIDARMMRDLERLGRPLDRAAVEGDRLRLERSTLALARGTASVARVAADAGYADHSHFCRRFRRAYGVVPSAYRAMLA